MLISEVIQHVKDFSTGVDSFTGKAIDDATTRDQVLYGSTDTECTGIVTCICPRQISSAALRSLAPT